MASWFVLVICGVPVSNSKLQSKADHCQCTELPLTHYFLTMPWQPAEVPDIRAHTKCKQPRRRQTWLHFFFFRVGKHDYMRQRARIARAWASPFFSRAREWELSAGPDYLGLTSKKKIICLSFRLTLTPFTAAAQPEYYSSLLEFSKKKKQFIRIGWYVAVPINQESVHEYDGPVVFSPTTTRPEI